MPNGDTKPNFWTTPMGVAIAGLIIVIVNNIATAINTYVQNNMLGAAIVDTVTTAVEEKGEEVKDKVQDSEEDVIKEAEVVADKLAPVNEIIEGWGQPAADPQRGLINLDKLIPPEDRAKMYKAGVDTARIADAAEAIQAAVEAINQRLAAEPLQPTAAPEDYPPDPGPVAEGGPPQEPAPTWQPRAR